MPKLKYQPVSSLPPSFFSSNPNHKSVGISSSCLVTFHVASALILPDSTPTKAMGPANHSIPATYSSHLVRGT